MDIIFTHSGPDYKWLYASLANNWFNSIDTYLQTNQDKVFAFDPYAVDVVAQGMTGWMVHTLLAEVEPQKFAFDQIFVQNSIWWARIRKDTYPYTDSDMMKN